MRVTSQGAPKRGGPRQAPRTPPLKYTNVCKTILKTICSFLQIVTYNYKMTGFTLRLDVISKIRVSALNGA